MKIRHLIFKEICFRKLNFALSVISVMAAIACLVGALVALKAHDRQTHFALEQEQAKTKHFMDELNSDIRKAMLKLGFNVVVLPKEQNLADWYADDFGSKYMPEEYVTKLANSEIVTVRHLLPSIQQKITWPEKKRKIILIGTRGEVPNIHKNPKKPLVEPVAEGTVIVGYELHQSMKIKTGDMLQLLGKEFVVAKCHDERGSKDDITLWIHLKEAQNLLGKDGQISAILALECACAWADIEKVRKEITHFLPDTQVIEKGSKALARAEARMKVAKEAKDSIERVKVFRANLKKQRQKFSSILVSVVIVGAVVWVGLLAFGNVRNRRQEIGILRAMGYKSRDMLLLFLSKAIITGILGALGGFVIGLMGGILIFDYTVETQGNTAASLMAGEMAYYFRVFLCVLVITPLLTAAASWIPAQIGASQDPAEILGKE